MIEDHSLISGRGKIEEAIFLLWRADSSFNVNDQMMQYDGLTFLPSTVCIHPSHLRDTACNIPIMYKIFVQ